MNILALFAQGVTSSRYRRVVLISEQYLLSGLEIWSPAASDMMASGVLEYFLSRSQVIRNLILQMYMRQRVCISSG